MHHLVGAAEVAEILGVSRQRVGQLAESDASFPRPEVELAAGRIWSRAAIEVWRVTRRPPSSTMARMNDEARGVILGAVGWASRWGHAGCGTEHLLRALTESAQTRTILLDVGVTDEQVEAAVLAQRPPGETPPIEPTKIPFTPAGKQAVERTAGAALLWEDDVVQPVHFLLVIGGGHDPVDGLGRDVLAALGANPDMLTTAVLEARRSG